MASAALDAEDKSIAAADFADSGSRSRQTFDEFLELAGFVKLSDLLSAPDISPSDENPRQTYLGLVIPKDRL